MEEPHAFAPQYPPSDERLEAAMGRFIIAWGVLERQLDGGIAILLQIDGTLSLCVSANLGTKAKVEMLMSAANMSGEAIGDDLADGAIACLRKISKMSGRFRNTLAHGQPSLWDVDDAPIWKWTRASAREFLDVAHSRCLTPVGIRRSSS
jgi:hypothetical protein